MNESTVRYSTFGQRLRAYVNKGWQRGSGWYAALGEISVNGPSQAAAMDLLAERVRKVCDTAYDKGCVVQHEDGTLTICQWFGDVVSQTRVRDGRVVVTSSGDWKTPQDAAEAATSEGSAGPGVVIRL
jgi:hypothetical protein